MRLLCLCLLALLPLLSPAQSRSGTIQVERPCDCTEVPAVLPDGSPIVPDQPGMSALQGRLILPEESSVDLRCLRIEITRNERPIAQTCPDVEGEYSLFLRPGTYTIRAMGKGLVTKQINGVIANAEKTTFLNLKMTAGDERLTPKKKRRGRKRRRK